MTDPIDFERSVARFGAKDVGYIVDLLRGVYTIMNVEANRDDTGDTDAKLFLGDFIEALEDCDSIEIVDDTEMLVDEG